MQIALRFIALLMAAALAAPLAQAEEPGPLSAAPAAPVYSQAELDQMLAPIALYPDALLTQILVASTYPLEVVSLQRWLDRNPGLAGDALMQALEREPWDASVKALAPFPRVVATMSNELEWTQRLGNAFLAQQDAVMDAVQNLREKALQAGTLRDDARERVTVDGYGAIIIEPAQPEIMYVPTYDPATAYGPWWWPAYPPYWWGYYADPWFWIGGIGYGYVAVGGWWHDHHAHADWHGHHVDVHHPGGSSAWRHDPSHRGGVAYPDNRTRQYFRGNESFASGGRRDYRGFDVRPSTGSRGTPAPSHPYARDAGRASGAPPTRSPLNPVPRDIGRAQSERGHQSLGTWRAPSPSHSAPSHSAPSHSAPSQSAPSHGGGSARGAGSHK